MTEGQTLTAETFTREDWYGREVADLRGSDLTALDPLVAELTDAIIGPEQAIVIALALGLSVR